MKADGEDPSSIFKVMANKYGVSEAQILLRWALQQEFSIIPKSSNQDRIKQNIDLDSFEIDETDMQKLSSINRSDGGVAWPEGDPILIN
jgi:2,5-diketo-D-gluconate reductase A